MEKEFVPFQTAKKLRAIGFDESCCAFYEEERVVSKPEMVDDKDQYRVSGWRTCKNSEVPMHYFAAATFSQAFRWFRKEHQIEATPCAVVQGSTKWYNLSIIKMINKKYDILCEYEKFNTYEEAERACLEKLIEIVESKLE